MADGVEAFCTIENLYVAYRKAKAEAFHENTHFHAVAFTRYEQNLHANLAALRRRLCSKTADWSQERAFIGDHAYLPKSVDQSKWSQHDEAHFRALDPSADWSRRFAATGVRAPASLRLVMRPTVAFQVVAALWVLHVGHLFDAALDKHSSYGNRLRRSGAALRDDRSKAPGLNLNVPGLFVPYFSAYRQWRERGLTAMESALASGESVLAVTMDVEKFYHRACPNFIIRPLFLRRLGLELSRDEFRFTEQLLEALGTWYSATPDASDRSATSIPVGLSASKIIANVLLIDFDEAVIRKLKPKYYGRYVDDIFLVLEASEADLGVDGFANRLAGALSPLITRVKSSSRGAKSLRLNLPYAKDSEIVFSGNKQKVFMLSSEHGRDLVQHIRDQIRQQSSEYRLLPSLPETGHAMASKALLATSDPTLQVDALRKADAVSVKRLGFSLLLSDIETYAADLRPETWKDLRSEFYGLVARHVVTPTGFFDYFGYIHRVYGLMLCCGDVLAARNLVEQLTQVSELLVDTTTLGVRGARAKFDLCIEQYAVALLQAGLQAATVHSASIDDDFVKSLRAIKWLCKTVKIPSNKETLAESCRQMMLADWGRRPYKEYWLHDQASDEVGPPVPTSMKVRRVLRLGGIRRFLDSAKELKVPHWPALVFPTRPLRVEEIALVAPIVLSDQSLYKRAIRLLRGAWVAHDGILGFSSIDDTGPVASFSAPGSRRAVIRVALTSMETTQAQWELAAREKGDRSIERYKKFNGLINDILREKERIDYIVMPELSIPYGWALRASRKLARTGISMIAGVEYRKDRKSGRLRNDCLVSLISNWPGYFSSVTYLQPKFQPAHAEKDALKELLRRGGRLYEPTGLAAKPIIYEHLGFYFSILVCSDLTNISHRNGLRGGIDALFALEWNPDTNTFSSLVEASASDLNAFIVQVNNRKYGDSRIRSPAVQPFERDLVQVKGGTADYYVIGELDYQALRKEQQERPKKPKYKPTPIGYKVSSARKKERPD